MEATREGGLHWLCTESYDLLNNYTISLLDYISGIFIVY